MIAMWRRLCKLYPRVLVSFKEKQSVWPNCTDRHMWTRDLTLFLIEKLNFLKLDRRYKKG